MSVTKIWSNAFQLDYLPFLLSITFERCFILPLYAFLWEGQNDPICDGSNFLFMYKKKWDPPFLISFYLHNTFFGVKVFQIHQNAENFNKKKSSEQKSIQTHFKTSKVSYDLKCISKQFQFWLATKSYSIMCISKFWNCCLKVRITFLIF